MQLDTGERRRLRPDDMLLWLEFVWLRRFRKRVLPALRRKVNMLKFKSVYLAVCTYLRGMVH
ncbi:hypothetical protein AC1031_003742 [Aphanomyces cochlioides]|nr:hypothetical protein AC1031_003742 [Aphanomyces cochlioides]